MSSLAERRQQLQAVQRLTFAGWFDAGGRAREPLADPRVAWQVALVLLGGNAAERTLAAAILRQAPVEPCHFRPYYAACILVRFGRSLPPAVRRRVEQYVKASLARATAPDIRFHGFNDNFPAMATALLALAGRYFKSRSHRRYARENLLALHTLLRRRAWLSEFNSPTYTPITLAALAEAAEHADDEQIRSLALEAEHRVWDDLAAHWHGPTCQPAGPFSRAYECDRVAQFTSLHVPVWLATGDACFLDPSQSLFPPRPEQVIHHEDDVRFVQGFTAAISAAPYHPPPGLATRLWHKRLDVTVTGDCEAGTFGALPVDGKHRILYGCSANTTTTWLGNEFSLGTSRRPFLDGNQACAFLAVWRRNATPRALGDVRSCFAWYTVDEQQPGRRNPTPLQPTPLDRDQIYDHGRCVSVQHEGAALVLYRPKLELAGHPLRRLALQLVLPLHAARPPEIWVGAKRLRDVTASVRNPAPITIREGRTVVQFRPLLGSSGGAAPAISLAASAKYLTVSFVNVASRRPRRFTEAELISIANGFVCEVRELDPAAPLPPLLEEWSAGRITDETQADRRSVRYSRPGLELALGWCPATESVQFATINGENAPG